MKDSMSQNESQLLLKMQKKQILREFDELGLPPTQRIKKREARRLKVVALLYDLVGDTLIGFFIPVLGDLSSWPIAKWLMQYMFARCEVSKKEYEDASSGENFRQATDAIIGFIPILGDIIDLFYIATFLTTRQKIRAIQNLDRNKRKTYNAQLRKIRQRLQVVENQEAQIENRQPRNVKNTLTTANGQLRSAVLARKSFKSPYSVRTQKNKSIGSSIKDIRKEALKNSVRGAFKSGVAGAEAGAVKGIVEGSVRQAGRETDFEKKGITSQASKKKYGAFKNSKS